MGTQHSAVTLGCHLDKDVFADEVRGHVDKHAKKGRNEWKEELLGEQ